MKKKYYGIVTLSISILAVCAIAGYFGTGIWQHPTAQASNPMIGNTPGQIKVPSTGQVRRMVQLYDRMAQLAHPAERSDDLRSLALFGYQSGSRMENENSDLASGSLADRKMRLTLTVLAGLFRYCIVDGSLLAEGAATADGGSILKIEAHRVLVALEGERKWIFLEDDRESSAISDREVTSPGKGRT